MGAGAVLLNVNVPDVPPEQLGPWQVTRLGRRHHAEPVVQSRNPRGETIYWVGAVGRAQDAGPGTDFHTVAAKGVSVTPLQLDLTAHHTLDLFLLGWPHEHPATWHWHDITAHPYPDG